MRYHFALVNSRGDESRFLFHSFRDAYPRAVANGAEVVFTDRDGVEHLAEPLAGEEYPGVPA